MVGDLDSPATDHYLHFEFTPSVAPRNVRAMYRRCGFRHEKKLRSSLGIGRIAGIDEAGRGALAGPVVAAAAILPERFRHRKLNDSKQLAPEAREKIYRYLTKHSEIVWAVGIVDSIEIDRINILRAAHEAMRLAVAGLAVSPEHVLIDGLPVFPFPFPQTALVDGDCLSLSIAAASVIAKVTRDALMRIFAPVFPNTVSASTKATAPSCISSDSINMDPVRFIAAPSNQSRSLFSPSRNLAA